MASLLSQRNNRSEPAGDDDGARAILRLREEHRTAITEQLGRAAGNGHKVLEHLYQLPIISVNDAKTLTGTTYQAATDLSARDESMGILR